MSRGQTPRPRHDGPLRSGGGPVQAKRRGGCRTGPHGPVRRPGNPPGLVMPPSRGAWRCKRGRGIFSGRADEAQRWQARCAETVLAATAGRPARRSRRFGRQRKASQGTLAALLRLRPSRTARQRIAHHNSATPRPPRALRRGLGRGRSCFGFGANQRLARCQRTAPRGRHERIGGVLSFPGPSAEADARLTSPGEAAIVAPETHDASPALFPRPAPRCGLSRFREAV